MEVRRVTAVAVSSDALRVAFILKQPLLQQNVVRFGLYVVERNRPGLARKLLESPYIGHLEAHPGTDRWTVCADLGNGTQIYDIDPDGTPHELVRNDEVVSVGTFNGLIGGMDVPYRAGVLSFGWAPDGRSLWYSRLRLRSGESLDAYTAHGVVYDDVSMSPTTVQRAGVLAGMELHLFEMPSGADRALYFVPTSSPSSYIVFSQEAGSIFWTHDSRHIVFWTNLPNEKGHFELAGRVVDVRTGSSRELPPSLLQRFPIPSPIEAAYIAIERKDSSSAELIKVDTSGAVVGSLGRMPFAYQSSGSEWGLWTGPERGELLLGVRYRRHDGLILVSPAKGIVHLNGPDVSLRHCDFSRGGDYGVCVAESLSMAPRLVEVSVRERKTTPLVNLNERHESLTPLKYEWRQWENKYGNVADGFIIYPSGYSAEKRYPAILLTHGRDARNRFVDEDLQWAFPAQLYAQLGYFVLAVNEADGSSQVRAEVGNERETAAVSRNVLEMQRQIGLDAVATMEAALSNLIAEGRIDPDMTGFSGWSRGAEVGAYVMTQSTLFRAASLAEGVPSAWLYWNGTRLGAAWQTRIYGGSPYDPRPEIVENYRRFAPAFRAARFAGPLLQQSACESISNAFELDRALKDVHIPTELVCYPNESHQFWRPSHRAAVMERNIDWFDYWLLGKRREGARDAAQYERWEELRRTWSNYRSASRLPKSTSPH